jgi:hypothetical protein
VEVVAVEVAEEAEAEEVAAAEAGAVGVEEEAEMSLGPAEKPQGTAVARDCQQGTTGTTCTMWDLEAKTP